LNLGGACVMWRHGSRFVSVNGFGCTTWGGGVSLLKFRGVIGFLGTGLVIGGGAWLGGGLSRLYMDVYRFPYLDYSLRPVVIGISLAVGLVAAGAGAVVAVLRAAGESPAVAMQPANPGKYRRSSFERGRLLRRHCTVAELLIAGESVRVGF